MADPVKRRYHSPSRQAQAARTRGQILDAADRLFRGVVAASSAVTTLAAGPDLPASCVVRS